MKKDDLVLLLVKAQIDPEVKGNQELLAIIEGALADLKRDEPVNLVATKTSASLSSYLLSHHLTAPQTVLNVKKATNKEANKYHGTAYTAMLLGGLFGGH